MSFVLKPVPPLPEVSFNLDPLLQECRRQPPCHPAPTPDVSAVPGHSHLSRPSLSRPAASAAPATAGCLQPPTTATAAVPPLLQLPRHRSSHAGHVHTTAATPRDLQHPALSSDPRPPSGPLRCTPYNGSSWAVTVFPPGTGAVRPPCRQPPSTSATATTISPSAPECHFVWGEQWLHCGHREGQRSEEVVQGRQEGRKWRRAGEIWLSVMAMTRLLSDELVYYRFFKRHHSVARWFVFHSIF